MTQPDWAARVATDVARQVKRYRKIRGLSAQQLSDACAELGMTIQRSVLANFESGRRTTVTVAELLVLAKALGVPVPQLLYPIGEAPQVEALPGETRPTWATVRWFTGLAAFPKPDSAATTDSLVGTDADNRDWLDGGRPLSSHFQHSNLLFEIEQTYRLVKDRLHPDDVRMPMAVERLDRLERQLAEHRAQMRRAGCEPPPLPDRLRHVDTATSQPIPIPASLVTNAR